MKKLFKLATVATLLGLTANIAQADDKIAFVEPSVLMQYHPLAVEQNQKFAEFMKANEAKFAPQQKALADEEKALLDERKKLEDDAQALHKEQAALEESIKKEAAQLEKDAPRLRAKEIQARQDKINAKTKPFQKKVEAIQKREADFQAKAEAWQKKANELQAEFEKAQKESGNLMNPAEVEKKVVEDINAKIKQVAEEKGFTVILRPSVALYVKDEKVDITEAVLSAVGGKLPEPAKAEQPAPETKPAEAK